VAHRDFNEAKSGGGEAWRRAGRGEVSTAAFRQGLEKNGSGWSYDRVELALGGRKRWLRSWRSCCCARVVRKGSRRGEFGRRSKLVGVGVARRRSVSTAARGFIPATQCLLRMRTPRRCPAGKQLRGQARGGAGHSSSAAAAEHPPCSSTVASPI